jgi:hypothetical protein
MQTRSHELVCVFRGHLGVQLHIHAAEMPPESKFRTASRMEKTVQRRSGTVSSQRHASEFSKPRIVQQALASLLALVLLCAE